MGDAVGRPALPPVPEDVYMVLFRLIGVETVVFEGMVAVTAVLTRPVPLSVGVVPLSGAPVLLPKGAEEAGVGETIPFDEPFE